VGEVYAGPAARPLDVVQINYYNPVAGRRLAVPGRRTAGGRAWTPFRQIWDDPVDPVGLARYCRLNHEPGLELWVAENGLCNRVRHGVAYPRHDGWDRVRFLRAMVKALAATPASRYYHWTLADNYEWGSYEHRFGLYRVDDGRWSDHDAFGGDAAGTYRALAAGA
jgi:beta-glucosidase/6-phospho-beta-glucosidase/beta-galactosidase